MKKTRNALAAATVASLTLSSLMLAVPAQALELDVRDASFDFANPLDADILADADAGDSYFYANVATVEGSQIDALVTFVAASSTSVGAAYYEEFDQTAIDALNVVDANAVDVPGCYSNAAYIDAMDAGNPYAETDFVSADFLSGGDIQAVDEVDYDLDTQAAINTNADLCTFDGSVDGFVTIRVDFQVGGSPVTLNNLAIFAGDIDSLQSVTLSDPLPTATYLSPTTQLTVTEVPGVSVEFKSPDTNSDVTDPDAADFVAEAQYSGVSSLTYTFGLEDAGGGSLSMLFDSFFNPTLPDTGVDVTSGAVVGGSLLVLGAAVVLIMRRRRQSV